MNAALPVFLSACVAVGAAAQGKPATGAPAPVVPPLATSNQGQASAPVDIVLALRHAPPGEGTCEKGSNACDVPEHWLVELQPAGGKPVLLTLNQQAELQKELTSAGSIKARTLGAVTISDATVSLRVSLNTPYVRVQALLAAVAQAGFHKTEFAVASPDTVEQRLTVPLPTDAAAKVAVVEAPAGIEEVRVALFWDKTKGEVICQLRKQVLPRGAEGYARLRSLLKDIAEDLRRVGMSETPGVIDAAGAIPWEAVVQVIDAFRAAGMQNIQFAAGKARK